jgi:hypothetical protein
MTASLTEFEGVLEGSCIFHNPLASMAIVKEDYCLLMDNDAVAAAILGLFEYWADGEISLNPSLAESNTIPVGKKSIAEFQESLLGLSTDKQIRTRLKKLEALGFIQAEGGQRGGAAQSYVFNVARVQAALDFGGLQAQVSAPPVPGFIYLIHATGSGRYKIGLASNVQKRMRQLSKQSAFPLALIASHPSDDMFRDESAWHKLFEKQRVHGEWFELSTEQEWAFRDAAKARSEEV